MTERKLLLLAAVAGAIAACADGTGPPIEPDDQPALVVEDGQLRQLRWKASDTPRSFTPRGKGTEVHFDAAGAMASASAGLANYVVSFWAVRNQTRAVEIRRTDDDGVEEPFLKFVVPSGSLLAYPNGKAFKTSDSVLITLSIDTTQFLVQMEPSGLSFNALAPAILTMWYSGADPDFDGDGDTDEVDESIESLLLRMWYQPLPGTPWTAMNSEHDASNDLYSVRLHHFSGYAISW